MWCRTALQPMQRAPCTWQAAHIFERTCGMATYLTLGIEYACLSECHGGGAMHYLAQRPQRATGRAHKAGFHFHGDHPQLRRLTACSRGHGDIQQSHQRPAVGHPKRVQVLLLCFIAHF